MSIICSIDGCSKSTIARGWCSSHYENWRRRGNPIPRLTPGDLAKFIHEVAAPFAGDECLLWPYGGNSVGYGTLTVSKRRSTAHRYVCELTNGAPPTRHHQAAHNCGNRGCVNPRHLRWATALENMHDQVPHGTIARGEKNGHAKLVRSDVIEIRRLSAETNVTRAALAARFGVSPSTISEIVHHKKWGWVEKAEAADHDTRRAA